MAKKPKVYGGIDVSKDLDDILDAAEKDSGLATGEGARSPISTGMLALDLVLSGGLMSGGWYSAVGGEQSCKTTTCMTQMCRQAVVRQVPILAMWDYEGSFSHDFVHNIAKGQGFKGSIQDLFGVKDSKGQYVKKPVIRLYQETVAEKFFDWLYRLERMLPDKLYRQGQWWLVYEDNKNNAKYKSEGDTNLYRKTGKIWVPVDNGYPQAFVVVDSYPSMLPERMDDDDASSGLGAQARMFSEQLKRVKGRMSSKRIIVQGVNQLREKPMTMGFPFYEPCGQALKYFSDCRIWYTSRSSVFGSKGKWEEEPSISGSGKDTYRYVHFRTEKNKLSVPNLEGWLRVWVKDRNGQAWGFDPVFDTFIALKSLGRVSGTKNKMTINVPGMEKHKPMTWLDFKALIIGDKELKTKTFKKLGVAKPIDIRGKLFKFIESGKAMNEYFATLAKSAKDGDDDE